MTNEWIPSVEECKKAYESKCDYPYSDAGIEAIRALIAERARLYFNQWGGVRVEHDLPIPSADFVRCADALRNAAERCFSVRHGSELIPYVADYDRARYAAPRAPEPSSVDAIIARCESDGAKSPLEAIIGLFDEHAAPPSMDGRSKHDLVMRAIDELARLRAPEPEAGANEDAALTARSLLKYAWLAEKMLLGAGHSDGSTTLDSVRTVIAGLKRIGGKEDGGSAPRASEDGEGAGDYATPVEIMQTHLNVVRGRTNTSREDQDVTACEATLAWFKSVKADADNERAGSPASGFQTRSSHPEAAKVAQEKVSGTESQSASAPLAPPSSAVKETGGLLPCEGGCTGKDSPSVDSWGDGAFSVSCWTCKRSTQKCATREEAIAAWNRRSPAPSDVSADEVELLPLTHQEARPFTKSTIESMVRATVDPARELARLRAEKDSAYTERDQLVRALSKLFPSSLERHPDSDTTWDDDWRWIVFVQLPTGQATWHIHDREVEWFAHLPRNTGATWDGHTTPEKYERLASLTHRSAAAKVPSVECCWGAYMEAIGTDRVEHREQIGIAAVRALFARDESAKES